MSNIYIRCDGSGAIGGGHVMRMLALAVALQKSGESVTFISYPLPILLETAIVQAGFKMMTLPGRLPEQASIECKAFQLDLEAEYNFFSQLAARKATLIVDHYGYTTALLERVSTLFAQVVLIDDYQPERLTAAVSVLVNPNFSALKMPYPAITGQTRLLGPHYAILKAEIQPKRHAPYSLQQECRNILVCLGFSDATPATATLLETINAISIGQRACLSVNEPELRVTVLLKPRSPYYGKVLSLAENSPHDVSVNAHTDDMASLMLAQDLVIVSASTMALESMALGLPTAIVSCADNQLPGALEMGAQGVACYLGNADDLQALVLNQTLTQLIMAVSDRERFSIAGQAAVNANGAMRVAEILVQPIAQSIKISN